MHKPAVALAADDKMAMALAVAARSVAENCAAPIDIYILDAGISPENRRKISQSLEGTPATTSWFTGIAERVANLPNTWKFITRATYARLFLPDLLAEHNRVLYLDCDTVCRRDITPLFEKDLSGAIALGVADTQSPTLPFGVPRWFEMGRNGGDINYNAGVLLMDLDMWRSANATEQMLEYLQDGRHVKAQDQEAINAVLGHRIGQMDPRWNQQAEIFWEHKRYDLFLPYDAQTIEQIRSDPWIVHFCNNQKPWDRAYTHPFLDEWFAYLDKTAFCGWRHPPRTFNERARGAIASRLRRLARAIST